MASPFKIKKAVRQRRPLKICLEGISGSGKTLTALRLAFAMRRAGIGSRIAVADSENESAGLYVGETFDGEQWDYEVVDVSREHQHPEGYTAVYNYIVSEGYDIIIVDSMSHAWHGALEQVDMCRDKFAGWAKVTPQQRVMMSTLTDTRAHLIATMRVKSEYDRQEVANGKAVIRKIGTKADQREGSEYEFDCGVRLDGDHGALVEKIRGCTAMDGRMANKPGPDFWKPLFDWWKTGADFTPPATASTSANGTPSPRAAIIYAEAVEWLDSATDSGQADNLKAAWKQITDHSVWGVLSLSQRQELNAKLLRCKESIETAASAGVDSGMNEHDALQRDPIPF